MGFPLSFIHVGLPKCASTYLQNVWLRDPDYNALDLSAVAQLARQFAADELSGQFPAITGDVPTLDGHINMASNEGFTWAYANNPAKQPYIARLHGVSAQLLGEAKLTDNVLIMVRNPVGWLRSMHEQSIKEGGSDSFATFRERQQQLLLGPMNLSLVLREYGRYFGKIVLLSADELRHAPDTFWKTYAEELGVAEPSRTVLEEVGGSLAANKSLGTAIFELAMMNRYSRKLFNTFGALDGYRQVYGQEFQNLRDAMAGKWIWTNRRVVEFAGPDQLTELTRHLDLQQEDREAFQRIEISSDMADVIDRTYLQPLEQYAAIDTGLLAKYRTDLAAIVRG